MKKSPVLTPASHFLKAANLYIIVSWVIINSAFSVSAAPPEIVHPPRGQTVILYQQAAFGVIATGTAPLSYQWRKDGVPIAGATNDQMVIAQPQFSDPGRYSVLVSNAETTATSAEALLTVNAPQAGDVDFSFAWGGSINGSVDAVIVQPDGKILIGGGFSTVHRAARPGLARLNGDGSTDHTFMSGHLGASCMALQSDGKVIICGNNGIARLNVDGSLDSTFQAGHFSGNRIYSIALQRDGKALIARDLLIDGMDRGHYAIVRLNPDGTPDNFLVEIGGGGVADIAVQSDGKILIGGHFSTVNGVSRKGIARLNASGNWDGAFPQVTLGNGTDVDGLWVRDVEVEPGGKVLIGGTFTSVNGVRRTGLARLNPDGTLDTGFQPEISGSDRGFPTSARFALQSDGKVMLLGSFTMVNGVPLTNVARLHSDGTLDSGFGHAALGECYNLVLAVQTDGKVLLAGDLYRVQGEYRPRIARLNADASLDADFQNGFSGPSRNEFGIRDPIDLVVPQSNGKLLIRTRNGLARLQADGVLDSGFHIEPSGEFPFISTAAPQPDGKVLIGGFFSRLNGMPAMNIARLNSDGTLDSGFQAEVSVPGNVGSLTVQRDGKMLVVRDSTLIERLNADGARDRDFQMWSIPNQLSISGVVLQNDGKVLLWGRGNSPEFPFDPTPIRFFRLNTDGSLNSSFGIEAGLPGCGGGWPSDTFAVQEDGKIIMGVGCGDCGPRTYPVSRLHGDGTLDAAFHAEVSGPCGTRVTAIAMQRDGKVLIGGGFGAVNGESRTGIARLNADGTLDSSFQDGLSGTWGVNSFAFHQDGKMVITGDFSVVNGMPAAGIARLWGSADIPPRITSLNRSGAQVELRWDALPNRTYRVQYKDGLAAPWIDLAGNVSGSFTGTATKIDTTGGNLSQRFYRVELVP